MLRFFLLCAVAFGLAPLITHKNVYEQDGLPQYIVLFSYDAPRFEHDMERLRDWVKQDLSAVDSDKIEAIYSIGNFTGFSAYLTQEGVRQLRMHSHIRLIEESQIVTLPEMEMKNNLTLGDPFTTRADWGQMRVSEKALNLATTPANLYPSKYPSGSAQTYTSSDPNSWSWNGPVWSVPNNGQGAFVWVEDTGVNYNHQEFLDASGKTRVTIRQDFTLERNPPAEGDGNGHGTHCAGSIGGNSRGVAPLVGLGSLRVLNSGGSGTTSWVISGMDYAANNQVKGLYNILSMSLGGGYSASINQAADSTYAAGVTVVVAAGNDGDDACNYSPASAANAITVAASDASDTRTSWSNYGSCTDVFAPGMNIHSAWIGGTNVYNTISGTSMATPLTSGAIAIYATANPSVKPAGVTSAVKSSSTPNLIKDAKGSPNLIIYSGW